MTLSYTNSEMKATKKDSALRKTTPSSILTPKGLRMHTDFFVIKVDRYFILVYF